MAQHDYTIANAPGATVRSDLNSALNAIATQNSGASAPATTFAFMMWFDTTNSLMKIRDSGDANWVTVASLSGTTWIPYRSGTALGDAAEKTVGVANGNVPVMDATGYPAADGSQITNITAANVLLSALTQGSVIDGANDLLFMYDNSATANRAVTPNTLGLMPTGFLAPAFLGTAPSGWVICEGTIGNASSGASRRANADTESLFKALWDDISDTHAPVSGGRGASAQADFDANKTLQLPSTPGKTAFGVGGTAPATIGDDSFGAETHTLTVSEMPSHTHSGTPSGNASSNTSSGAPHQAGGTSGSTGGDGSHNNMPPGFAANWMIKL